MSWLAGMALSGALNGLWIGLVLAALAAAALRAMPRANAATRYGVWFTALILVAAMPALSLLIPRPAVAAAADVAAPSAALVTLPATARWPVFAVLAWLAISAILLARVAWSVRHIRRLKRNAAVLGMRDGIRLLASNEIRVPMAAGFVRRAIIFPQSVIAQLDAAEYEQVLSHELAHLRRYDDWTQLAQAVTQAVLFFHPAVYWIGRHLKIEREIACDDWVVGATGKARPYAACLTRLHELTRRSAAPRLAPGATRQIGARIDALLRADRNGTPRLSRGGWAAACALVIAGVAVATQVAPPVGVQELPVAPIEYARIQPPGAPAISLTARARPAPARHRLLAKRTAPQPEEVVLVRAWRIEPAPTYFVITVVFFRPPPPPVLSGI